MCDEPNEAILEAEWKHIRALRAAATDGQETEEGSGAVPDGRKVGEIRP